jgi:hypothetical protein
MYGNLFGCPQKGVGILYQETTFEGKFFPHVHGNRTPPCTFTQILFYFYLLSYKIFKNEWPNLICGP